MSRMNVIILCRQAYPHMLWYLLVLWQLLQDADDFFYAETFLHTFGIPRNKRSPATSSASVVAARV